MLNITDRAFYEENEAEYNTISDYINDLGEVHLNEVTPAMTIGIELSDCYLDDKGDLYIPQSYDWKQSDELDKNALDTYIPVYSEVPNLTKLEIANMVAQVEQPELNDPARTI